MSPRKSSTSSGNRFPRPRYLAVEVTGVPTLSGRELEQLLRRRLEQPGAAPVPVRIVRVDGPRSLVEVPHDAAPEARRQWNGRATLANGREVSLSTRRTYGTLRKGKVWLRGGRPNGRPAPPRPRDV